MVLMPSVNCAGVSPTECQPSASGAARRSAAGLVAPQSLSAVLYGVPPADPVSLAIAAIVLGITAMAACYVPARRAARIDPARTLTTE